MKESKVPSENNLNISTGNTCTNLVFVTIVIDMFCCENKQVNIATILYSHLYPNIFPSWRKKIFDPRISSRKWWALAGFETCGVQKNTISNFFTI